MMIPMSSSLSPAKLLLAAVVMYAAAQVDAADAACKQVRAETDVIGIRIADASSAVKVIGSRTKPGGPTVREDKTEGSFPYVRFANENGREELTLIAHYGDEVDSYNEIEVAPAAPGGSRAKRLPVAAFATERGVKLGMPERALIGLLGNCFTRQRGKTGESVIQYAINDAKHPLLKRAAMPSYYAHYTFRNGVLARFKFGFEYP
jgi:hypothetical protein